MKAMPLFAVLLCLLVACEKTPPQATPAPITKPSPNPTPTTGMDTTNFNNREIVFRKSVAVDLDHDGTKDFYVYTQLIGDAILKRDYKRFYIGTSLGTDFPINQNEEVPVLTKGHVIAENAFHNYNWYEAAAIAVAQKVITYDGFWWEGLWRDKYNQYVPLRIHKNGKAYYGWVELSFDSRNEKLILHRAAVSRQADVQVTAGN